MFQKNLLERIRVFLEAGEHTHEGALIRRLATYGQAPHALFIGCSDARTDPALLTEASLGDLFVVRNIGALVPSPQSTIGQSVFCAVDYALDVLNVSDVFVMSHRDCGAVNTLFSDPKDVSEALKAWLKFGQTLRARLSARLLSQAESMQHILLGQCLNVFSLHHLLQHPPVQERLKAGTLKVHGWYFDIPSRDLLVYDPEFGGFKSGFGHANPASVPLHEFLEEEILRLEPGALQTTRRDEGGFT